ncbi:MAG TPA: FAD binding domain-containing protein [Alphaproteobacteria bacterium]|nr:FAD binding domain-containing protein [Alphaproteobacteria bacterium]
MTKADTRFFTPHTIAEATGLLARGMHYRCLAGGGLVVPALREGQLPAGLISLRRVAGLRGIERLSDGTVRIGAMTPHAEVMRSNLLAGGMAVVRLAAAEIAHPVIRNMATIGGTLCRADPAADYGCALLAADAIVRLRSDDGERVLALEDFWIADGATMRRDDELLVAVSLPADTGQGSSGYARFSRVDGDYPVASAAVRLEWEAGHIVSARVAVGGCGPTAYPVEEAEALLDGVSTMDDVPPALSEAAVAAAQPRSDLKGSAAFRRMLIPGLLDRALRQAFAGAAI